MLISIAMLSILYASACSEHNIDHNCTPVIDNYCDAENNVCYQCIKDDTLNITYWNKDFCELHVKANDKQCNKKDSNLNHMDDTKEEPKLFGKSCKNDSDCRSISEYGHAFCDSFIGYQCATKCTADDQCLAGFICRDDGRCASEFFTTVWNNKDRGNLTKLNTLTLINNSTAPCHIKVYWDWTDGVTDIAKDGEVFNDCSKPISHDYSKTDKDLITVKISGNLNNFILARGDNNAINSNAHNLLEIQSFGSVGLSEWAFEGCKNLRKLSEIDIPDSTKLTNMDGMFFMNCSLNAPMNQWDVSHVTSMTQTFRMVSWNEQICDDNKTIPAFNPPLNHWDVSNVTSMQEMFMGASDFNQPLNDWDVSKVQKMNGMFARTSFNKSLDNWNLESIESTASMFQGNTNFKQSLIAWANYIPQINDMHAMFSGAVAFKDNISSWKPNPQAKLCDMLRSSGITKEKLQSDCQESNTCDWNNEWNKLNLDSIFGIVSDPECSK